MTRDLFEAFKTYPHVPGWQKTDTSKAAADQVSDVAGLRKEVLKAIQGSSGLTTEEIETLTGIDYRTAQPRTSELRALGFIEDSGQRRRNRSGRAAIVWIACNGERKQ